MKLLYNYLKNYWGLVALALLLAAINTTFSLLDPYIFSKVTDGFGTHPEKYSQPQFINGVIWLLCGTMGVAMVSRIAKNFQDYFTNIAIQPPLPFLSQLLNAFEVTLSTLPLSK
jgi:ATP-binding cassette subfamily B protein